MSKNWKKNCVTLRFSFAIIFFVIFFMIQEMEQMELNTRLRQSYQEAVSVPQKYYIQDAQEIPFCSSSVPCSSP
jgi:large-conductance mechanosensitive channel